MHGFLARLAIVASKVKRTLIERVVFTAVSSDYKALARLHIAVDGDCALLTSRNSINGKSWSGISVTSS